MSTVNANDPFGLAAKTRASINTATSSSDAAQASGGCEMKVLEEQGGAREAKEAVHPPRADGSRVRSSTSTGCAGRRIGAGLLLDRHAGTPAGQDGNAPEHRAARQAGRFPESGGAVKERPILFSAPMVRAILDGSKTQTRRVVKLPIEQDEMFTGGWKIIHKLATHAIGFYERTLGRVGARDPVICPYGQPGDRLWVRESWSIEMLGAFGTDKGYDRTYALRFRADDAEREIHVAPGEPDPYIKLYDNQRGDWRPSIHMPRWANRILLEIVSVRVERLNDCSGPDALAEGVSDEQVRRYLTRGSMHDGYDALRGAAAVHAFEALWEQINGAGSWDANPFVWVVEFKRVVP